MPSYSFIKKPDRKPAASNRRGPSDRETNSGLPQMRRSPQDGIPNATDGKTSRGSVPGMGEETESEASETGGMADSEASEMGGMSAPHPRLKNLGKFAWAKGRKKG